MSTKIVQFERELLSGIIFSKAMEQTLILLKPDTIKRGLIGAIIGRFEKVGLKLVGIKMLHPDEQHYHHHYETISGLKSRVGEDVFNKNSNFMMTGPVIAIVLQGVGAVNSVRKMVGATDPSEAQPGTIRGDFAHVSVTHANNQNTGLPNVIHASGNLEEAKKEVSHWFNQSELFDYKTVQEHLTQPLE